MNKELAKTLTIALVNYLDENRPKRTMDCSSGECVSLEKAFTEENFDSVETLVNKKLTRLSEFELRLLDWLSSDTSGEIPMERMKEVVKHRAEELLAIAKKELLKDDELANELAKKHLDGYCLGREDALRDMMDFVESQFHGKKAKEFDTPTINIPTWTPPCYKGGPCTNPQKDCINCPRANVVISPNTASGTSTSTLHGNTSATDGKEHNPSFTD